MSLKEELKKYAQIVPIVIIKVGKIQFLADGGSRSDVYGLETKSIIHECKNLSEAFDLWKGLISHNPRANKEEKIAKFTRLAEVLRTVFKTEDGEISNKLGVLLGISRQAVSRYLPDKYKDVKQQKIRKGSGETKVHQYIEKPTAPVKKLGNYELFDTVLNLIDKEELPKFSEDESRVLRCLKDALNRLFPESEEE